MNVAMFLVCLLIGVGISVWLIFKTVRKDYE